MQTINLTIWAGSTIGYPVRSLNIATNSSAILENKDVKSLIPHTQYVTQNTQHKPEVIPK